MDDEEFWGFLDDLRESDAKRRAYEGMLMEARTAEAASFANAERTRHTSEYKKAAKELFAEFERLKKMAAEA